MRKAREARVAATIGNLMLQLAPADRDPEVCAWTGAEPVRVGQNF